MNSIPIHVLSRLVSLSTGPLYLVGGTVRDLLRRVPIKDIDVIMQKGSDKVARAAADSEGGSFFFLDEQRHMSRVMLPCAGGSVQLDFADFEGADLAADLARRDFTVNAMAVDIREYLDHGDIDACGIIDLHGGQEDLRNGIIRTTAPRVLDEDPLRLLRAVRFAAVLHFTLHPDTVREIRLRAGAITKPSPERVRDELFLILSEPSAGIHLFLTESLGLLEHLFPELTRLKGFAPGKHHQYDILTHSIKTADYADQALEDLLRLADEKADRIREHFCEPLEQGITRMAALRFACLLHDIAKSDTFSRDEDGDVHFHGHDQVGADRAKEICARLRLSKAATAIVEKNIRNHMRPLQLSQSNGPSRRALYRYCRDLKDALPESLVLSLADGRATGEAMPPEGFQDTSGTVAFITKYYYEKYLKAEEKPLLSGRDLIELGLAPGPAFREILDNVRERQAAGELTGRREALKLVREMLGAGDLDR